MVNAHAWSFLLGCSNERRTSAPKNEERVAERPPEFETRFERAKFVFESRSSCKILGPGVVSVDGAKYLVEGKKEEKESREKKPGLRQAPLKQAQAIVRKGQKTLAPSARQIIRFLGRDVDGNLSIPEALRRVKGIGHSLSKAIARVVEKKLGVKKETRVGELSEEQVDEIEEITRSPSAHGIKWFQLNRARDVESGEQKQLLGADLLFAVKQDVARERETRSWRGWRHSIGQKVRGQHTRTTGRTGFTVGVLKKAVKAQKEAAAAAAQEKGEKPRPEKK